MRYPRAALLAASLAVCAPAQAFEPAQTGASTIFYVGIPLDSGPARLHYGLRLQGSREYQTVDIDSRMLHFLPLGGLEAKWVLLGAAALGAAAAVSKDKQAEQRAAAARQPCPKAC